jgi:copper oxidase (laccase) domain-containing protein
MNRVDSVDLLEKMEVMVFKSEEDVVGEVILPIQCHSDRIAMMETGQENIENCDALVTTNHELLLGIKTADCAPICFADSEGVGVSHVGWRGLCLGLIPKMLSHFNKSEVEVFVGPHLHAFEIKKDACYDEIVRVFGERFLTTDEEKIIFNFKEAIMSELPPEAKFDTRNTATDFSLPSYRRDGNTDRLVTVAQFNLKN